MQYSEKSLTIFERVNFFQYIVAISFIGFTIFLFLSTWKIQASCHPLVGKSPCISEQHSLVERSWNKTKDTVVKVKNTTSHVVDRSFHLLPTNFLNHQ